MPYKKKVCGVYSIKTPNNSIYIGSSCNILRRFAEHKSLLKNKKHHSVRLQRAFNKHGDNLLFEIVCECDVKELNSKEQEYITKLGARLNTTALVNNVYACPETREKLKKVHNSEEWKQARSIIAKNSKTRWVPVECSNGVIYKNMAEAAKAFGIRTSGISHLVKTHQKGRLGVKFKHTNEEWMPEVPTNVRRLETMTKNGNMVRSEESKIKMREAAKGRRPSLKAIEASVKSTSIPVCGISLKDGSMYCYKSSMEAARRVASGRIRTASSQINKCLNGVKKSAYGFFWRREKEQNGNIKT